MGTVLAKNAREFATNSPVIITDGVGVGVGVDVDVYVILPVDQCAVSGQLRHKSPEVLARSNPSSFTFLQSLFTELES